MSITKGRCRVLLALGLSLALLSVGCGSRGEPPASPTEVVHRFYRWHLGYPGNSLADGAYRANADLAESFIAEVDEILSSPDLGRVDPFLLAQDVPAEFDIVRSTDGDEESTVLVNLYWAGNPTPVQREVSLRFIDGRWQITGVTPVP